RGERPGEARRRAGGRALRGELRGRHVEAPPGARRPAGAAPPALRLRGSPARPAEAPHRHHGFGGEAPDRDAGGAAGGLRAAPAAIVACMTLYVVWAGASGDALAIALVLALSGVALLCPWGARAQVPLALGTLAVYLLALADGVRGGLPVPYGLLCVGGGAVTSILGAVFLDLHRRAIFHQRVLLERRRDEQLATLFDVTRTVAAALELRAVLRLVCQRMQA